MLSLCLPPHSWPKSSQEGSSSHPLPLSPLCSDLLSDVGSSRLSHGAEGLGSSWPVATHPRTVFCPLSSLGSPASHSVPALIPPLFLLKNADFPQGCSLASPSHPPLFQGHVAHSQLQLSPLLLTPAERCFQGTDPHLWSLTKEPAPKHALCTSPSAHLEPTTLLPPPLQSPFLLLWHQGLGKFQWASQIQPTAHDIFYIF